MGNEGEVKGVTVLFLLSVSYTISKDVYIYLFDSILFHSPSWILSLTYLSLSINLSISFISLLSIFLFLS